MQYSYHSMQQQGDGARGMQLATLGVRDACVLVTSSHVWTHICANIQEYIHKRLY